MLLFIVTTCCSEMAELPAGAETEPLLDLVVGHILKWKWLLVVMVTYNYAPNNNENYMHVEAFVGDNS